jgi:Uma2 family endonuclease
MATQPTTGLTYEDLQRFPEDNVRRELIGGELIVTASPVIRHQRAVVALSSEIFQYCKTHGGEVFASPTDVYFTDTDVVEPDVVFVRAENVARVERKFVRSAPDLVVEVSSPSTLHLDLGRKRELYERFGVPEYWLVDLEADRVEIYRLEAGHYAWPVPLGRGDLLESPLMPGFLLPVDDLLGPAED